MGAVCAVRLRSRRVEMIWWVGSSSQVLRALAIPASRFPLGAPSSTSPAGSISAPLSMSGISVVPPLSPPSSMSATGSGFESVTAAANVSNGGGVGRTTSAAPSATSSTVGASRPGIRGTVALGRG
ncbi:hypothetical protein C8R45DRAFT_1016063 [Mycena sanguinolenta]|nr:hypothetical protein C8R45DRAFT_1016063 [Mycena sanguinolenta]